tara:strand:+ start:94 stop:933 length:840 start_codon:yes stop_codon:yes gene_type:complete
MKANTIYPCLWFDGNAAEAAAFYVQTFPNSKVLQLNPMVASFELNGTRFMGLNGGPKYKVNPAVSYFVHCGSESEIERLYAILSDNGSVLMPLDKYDWSSKYAWVQDRFGVNWQLDIDDIRSEQKVVPCLMFANEKVQLVKEAITHYTTVFDPSRILMEMPYSNNPDIPDGTILFAQYKVQEFIFNAMSGSGVHDFDFTPANSFVLECETQEDIDYFWELLGKDGRYDQCGWLADKYGVSWQIIPAILPKLMADSVKAPQVVAAFMKMTKFDIEALVNA